MSGPFNFGPGDDEFDRFAREMGEGLKDMFGKLLGGGDAGQINWSKFAGDAFTNAGHGRTATKPHPDADPTTDTGSGVWAIVITDDEGVRVEQVFASEIDALRANQNATSETRRVRFLPYGIPVSAFERAPKADDEAEADEPSKTKSSTKPKTTAKKKQTKKSDD